MAAAVKISADAARGSVQSARNAFFTLATLKQQEREQKQHRWLISGGVGGWERGGDDGFQLPVNCLWKQIVAPFLREPPECAATRRS